MNLIAALRAAEDFGCRVYLVRKNGEVAVEHDGVPRSKWVRQNSRRKDATRALVCLLRRVSEAQAQGAAGERG